MANGTPTNLADIIEPTSFSQYTALPLPSPNRFVTSPVVANMQLMDLGDGGRSITIRYFKEPDVADEIMVTTSAVNDTPIASESEIAVVRDRINSFADYDLTKYVAGADPVGTVEAFIRDTHWVNRYAEDAKAVMTGVATASAFSSYVNNVTGETDKLLTVGNWYDTLSTQGDEYSKIEYLLVHSDVYHRLIVRDETDFVRPSEGVPFGVWRGMQLIVDDRAAPKLVVDASAGTTDYFSFGFASDSVITQIHPDGVNGMVMTEVDRDAPRSLTRLVVRRRYIQHLKGTKWVGTPAANSPTNAELATGGNWQNAFSNVKNLPWVCLRHRA